MLRLTRGTHARFGRWWRWHRTTATGTSSQRALNLTHTQADDAASPESGPSSPSQTKPSVAHTHRQMTPRCLRSPQVLHLTYTQVDVSTPSPAPTHTGRTTPRGVVTQTENATSLAPVPSPHRQMMLCMHTQHAGRMMSHHRRHCACTHRQTTRRGR
jgi:hypothetical protein